MSHNHLEDAVGVDKGVGIPEPKHLVAVLGKHGSATQIIAHGFILGVLAAVQLDDKISLAACKIGNERANRLLANEFETEQAPIPQARPELALGIGRVCAQPPGR
jgi:hypothetical protein